MFRFLPRTAIILGLVSFLNDSASEMITPLQPLFLTVTLGAERALLGDFAPAEQKGLVFGLYRLFSGIMSYDRFYSFTISGYRR